MSVQKIVTSSNTTARESHSSPRGQQPTELQDNEVLASGLCAAVGIVAAVIIRQILVVAGINDYVVAPLLTYTGLAVSATLLAWLLWFGH